MKLPTAKANSQTTVFLAAAAAVLVLAGVLSYTLCSRRLSAVTWDLQEKQKLVEDSKRIAARLADAEQRFEQANLDLSGLETSVATYQYVPTLLKQLEQLGKSTNLRVLSVRPLPAPAAPQPIRRSAEESKEESPRSSQSKAEKPKPYEELKIDIGVEGTYWRARNFIYRLTKFPKIIAVNQVHMTPSGVVLGRRSPRLEVRLNVTAFIFPNKEAPREKPEPSSQSTASAVGLDRRSRNEG